MSTFYVTMSVTLLSPLPFPKTKTFLGLPYIHRLMPLPFWLIGCPHPLFLSTILICAQVKYEDTTSYYKTLITCVLHEHVLGLTIRCTIDSRLGARFTARLDRYFVGESSRSRLGGRFVVPPNKRIRFQNLLCYHAQQVEF